MVVASIEVEVGLDRLEEIVDQEIWEKEDALLVVRKDTLREIVLRPEEVAAIIEMQEKILDQDRDLEETREQREVVHRQAREEAIAEIVAKIRRADHQECKKEVKIRIHKEQEKEEIARTQEVSNRTKQWMTEIRVDIIRMMILNLQPGIMQVVRVGTNDLFKDYY